MYKNATYFTTKTMRTLEKFATVESYYFSIKYIS